jgi:ribosomal protein S1
VKLHQHVTVKVTEVDEDRKRIQLTMKTSIKPIFVKMGFEFYIVYSLQNNINNVSTIPAAVKVHNLLKIVVLGRNIQKKKSQK